MGKRKDLKLAYAEAIAQAVYGVGYSLENLKKPAFDLIWDITHQLLEMKEQYSIVSSADAE